ncbi:hypothetical protein Y032_0113g369 [Ancylostoma ceylanicum]|uniref:Uncharacterized protein n=1 Tax=Ancylostoma ceylanicum TaxID=53326 RepID=A0A016TCN5_9BILA|nr:hypothetical protein Y032_0113g369 [Ancylostoma ceylanicum]
MEMRISGAVVHVKRSTLSRLVGGCDNGAYRLRALTTDSRSSHVSVATLHRHGSLPNRAGWLFRLESSPSLYPCGDRRSWRSLGKL